MNCHGNTATAHVQKRPVWHGKIRLAVGPREANAAASATLGVPTFDAANND
jgi:hypothetical protein